MIFDASSIFKAIEINKLEKLDNEMTITLAPYELGNIVKKEVLRGSLSKEEGLKLIDFISELLSVLKILDVGVRNRILEVAVNNNLSYYDASYLHASMSQQNKLVTEDKKLLDAASKHVDACKLEEL